MKHLEGVSNTMNTHHNKLHLAVFFITGLVATASMTAVTPAKASDAGAFVGGMLTSRVLNNMHRRTEAEEQQAAAAQQSAQASQRAASSGGGTKSVESRIQTLDELLAKGYISKGEYDQRKKAILNSI